MSKGRRSMRFTIMQRTPGHLPDGAAAEEAVTGQEGTVLRILLLHRGHALTKEEIARHLGHSGRNAVSPSSVPGYVARLRTRVGAESVRSEDGYSAAVGQDDVDAFLFERAIKEYKICDVPDVDNIDGSLVDRYDQLLELHAMWRANPALPFADDADDEFLAATYRDYERYWDCLRRCIIYCELQSRRKPRIEKAIGRLDQLLREDPDDEQTWILLFRARASLPGHADAVAAMLTSIRNQFPRGLPSELSYTVGRISAGHDDALFPVDCSHRTGEDERRIRDLVRTIGISPASELELRQSKLEPLECISQTVSQLCFAGVLATKWVADSYVRAGFARLLERLDNNGGSVRFLLLDPESESYRRFGTLRWSSGGTQSIDMLRSLSAEHHCFQVRLYDALPTFRIVLIDRSIVSFSPYLMESSTERARTGWRAPHIVLDRTAPWPLASTFE